MESDSNITADSFRAFVEIHRIITEISSDSFTNELGLEITIHQLYDKLVNEEIKKQEVLSKTQKIIGDMVFFWRLFLLLIILV